jgi:lipopolysaccharide transport system ATP-binding protein
MASPLIRVESVDKVYRIWKHPRARLTGSLAGRLARSRSLPEAVRRSAQRYSESVYREFFALKNISFEVNRGETIGIIGKNGSGKSTTLKVIAGTLQPTRGEVSVTGRIAAMLELAAGFEQEFTGRENVFLSAAILGLSKAEIGAKFEEIVDFADIGDFLDQPVKTYSSGMLVRLAFAVHTAVEPEILIIDEALSVGDETFRRKCFARLDRLKEEGTTILFVSHDLGSVVNLTERALFFHEGEIVMEGAPKDVVAEYQRYCHVSRTESHKIVVALKAGKPTQDAVDEETPHEENRNREAEQAGYRMPTGSAQYDPNFTSKSRVEYTPHGGKISGLRLYDEAGEPANLLQRRRTYIFEYKIAFTAKCEDVTFAMLMKTLKGHELGGSRTLPWDQFIEEVKAGQVYVVRFRFQTLLMPGVYFLNAGVEGVIEGKRAYVHRVLDALPFRVLPEKELMPTGTVDFLIEPEMELLEDGGNE